jgi:FkbM family methyltransferase
LKQDDMFYLHSTVQGVAFFTRSSAPVFDHKQKSWSQQSYNVQKYVGDSWKAYGVGLPFPFDITFDGRQNSLNPWFQRGFSLFNGRPITDGWYSEIKLPFEKPVIGPVVVTLDFEAIVPSWRPESGILIDINGTKTAEVLFENALRQRVAVVVEMAGERDIKLSLTHRDVRLAGHLGPLSGSDMPDCRQPNVVLHGLSVQLPGAAKSAGQMRRADGSIISFDCRGQTFLFFVENPHDSIQAHHNVGEFYEIEELELLTRLVPRGARILDIGANIGNHSVWFEKILGARSITPVEPQARMVALYRTNCQLNGLTTIDERCLGLALGDVNQSGDVQIDQNFNPAGARIEPSATGEIRIRIGDEVLADDTFDFVKIDVEGAEINVIRGLKKLFERCRPLLFVEVWEENRADFDALMSEFDYEVVDEFRRYDIATNLLLKSRRVDS